MSPVARSRVTKCPKCGQFTPAKGTSCLYCGTELVGLFSVEDRKPEPASGPVLPLKTGPAQPATTSGGPLKPATERAPPEVDTRSLPRTDGASTQAIKKPLPDKPSNPTSHVVRPGAAPRPPSDHGDSGGARPPAVRPAVNRSSSGSVPSPVLHEEPRQLGQGQPRFTKQADERQHFLVLDSGEPVLLDPGKLFVVGRDQRAGLVVRAPGVSRQHCEIDWQGETPRPVLAEVRSRYGTYLNNRPVRREEPLPLRDGDEIRLGPAFTILYRHVEERKLKENLTSEARSDTTEIRLPPQGTGTTPPGPPVREPAQADVQRTASGSWVVGTAGGFGNSGAPPPSQDPGMPDEGNLTQMPPPVLLETIYRSRRTGSLSLTSAQGQGEITLRDGKATGISFAGFTGQEALQKVLGLTAGVYRFREARPEPQSPPQRTVAPPSDRIPVPTLLRGYAANMPPGPVTQAAGGYPANPSGGYPPTQPAYPAAGATGSYGAPPQQPASYGAPTGGYGYPATQPGYSAPPQPAAPAPGYGGSTGSYGAPPLPGGYGGSGQTGSYGSPGATGSYGAPGGGGYGAPAGGYGAPAQPASRGAYPPPIDEETKALITPIIATIQAANLTGEGLGGFGGESAAQFLRDGALVAALEVCERVLELAQMNPPAEAAQARAALKGIMRNPQLVQRALELLEFGLGQRGPQWAAPQALRLLKLFDRDMPPGFEQALQALARL